MQVKSLVNKIDMTDELLNPRLRPRMHPRAESLLKNKSLIFDLIDKFGSPLNFVFPQNMAENITTFQEAYKKHNLRGKIYFTSKPCKSLALYREASGHEIGMDVSSTGSLEAALNNGWEASRIGATGPKNLKYLELGLCNNVLMNVDNFDELRQIISLHSRLQCSHKIRITIRLADYKSSHKQFIDEEDNTFGIASTEMEEVWTSLEQHKGQLDFQGFSWHSSAAGDEQRIAAMEYLLQMTFAAIKRGLKPSHINIGGGFPIMYADSCDEWNIYINSIKKSILGRIPAQTWNRTGLGFRADAEALRGSPSFLNHAPVYTKGEELDRWLSFRLPAFGNAKFSDIVRDSLLKLSIEPGRGMLDQCGITIGRVAFTKFSSKGNRLVGLEMNRSNIHADHLKQLTEPVVIPYGEGNKNVLGEGVFYTGNLCLSYDMIQYNKTYPDYLPQTGDLIAFSNTAAYMMDFTESEMLMQPLAQKIAVTEENGEWRWINDAEYRRSL